jgi:hypothetical protein
MAFLGISTANILLLWGAKDIRGYALRMRIFMPMSTVAIFLLIFTGMVLMAAKHLDFTVENIAMIIFSVVLTALEIRRYSLLKHANISLDNILEIYRAKAMRILVFELFATVAISAWMML